MDRITIPAEAIVSRTNGTRSPEGYIAFKITDRCSRLPIAEVQMSFDEFAKAVTGLMTETTVEVYPDNAPRWGLHLETGSVEVPHDYGASPGAAQAWANDYATDNGWDRADVHRTNMGSTKARLRRWVQKNGDEQ